MIDQPLGLAGRQHEIVFGDSSKVSAVDREPFISAIRDRRALEGSNRHGRQNKHERGLRDRN